MSNLRKKHPFLITLGKIAAIIVISFGTFIASLITLFLFVSVMAAISSFGADDLENPLPPSYRYVYGTRDSDNKILSIPIAGVILGGKESSDPLSFLDIGLTYGYEIKDQLNKASEDETIKGVILEVNSPGGTIFGSRAIADGISYYKEHTGKPVVAIVSGLGASGAYYGIVSADAIFADYGSTIGSIGVMTGPFKYYDTVVSEDAGAFIGGVVTQNGIDTTYITAGEFKDLGNPYRPLTSEERQVLQTGVNNEYDMFVSFVSSHRGIDQTVLRERIGALIYDNKTAEELGLIDGTMSKQQAYSDLGSRAQLPSDDYVVIQERTEPGFVEALFQSLSQKETVSSVTSLCPFASSILAYHGNITDLCDF